MDFITGILTYISEHLRPHTRLLALALVATLLSIYGCQINLLLKKFSKNFPFWIRLLLFILLCVFGYPFLSLRGTATAIWALSHIDNLLLFPVSLALFVIIGILAERKNKI